MKELYFIRSIRFSVNHEIVVRAIVLLALALPSVSMAMCKNVFSTNNQMEVPVKFRMGLAPEVSRLLAVVAMDVEEQAILRKLGEYEDIDISPAIGVRVKVFKKNRKEILLVTSGIGAVNAGLTTALVADRFKLDGVILFGVAGAVKPGLKIGQLVIASEVIQHDSIFSGESGHQLMAPGAPFVSIAPHERDNPIFKTDTEFRSWLRGSLEQYPLISYSEGTVLSGSEFVGSSARKLQIGSITEDALAVEMEAAGIALVAKRLNLPFAVLKTVADRLNPDDSVSTDYNSFIKGAAENAGDVMDLVWKSLTDTK